MIETNVKRKILELLREHEISPIDREKIEAYYFNTTRLDEDFNQLAQVSKVSMSDFDDKQDLVFDCEFCIERIMKGPWEIYDEV